MTQHKPVLTLLIVGGGYEFHTGLTFLQGLRHNLNRIQPGLYHQMRTQLHARGFSFSEMRSALLKAIPNQKATQFDPAADVAIKDSVITDLALRVQAQASAHVQAKTAGLDAGFNNSTWHNEGREPGSATDAERRKVRRGSNERMWQLGALAALGVERSSSDRGNEADGPKLSRKGTSMVSVIAHASMCTNPMDVRTDHEPALNEQGRQAAEDCEQVGEADGAPVGRAVAAAPATTVESHV